MADLKHTVMPCLRCDLTALLKTVATSKRGGAMNIGDGSELDRIEEALARVAELEQAHAEQVAERETATLIRATATKMLREVSAREGLLDGFSNLRSAWKDLQAALLLPSERARQAKGDKRKGSG